MNPLPSPFLPRARAAAAAATLCAFAIAQSTARQDDAIPASALRPHASPILAGPVAPDGTPSGIWGGGANYKASFHDGMTFYPYVGAELPHQPVRWRTTSVRAGNTELLRAGNVPLPQYEGLRCEYDLGAVIERYDVRDGGLEQSFVVRERPAAGDLVITGELTTPLVLPATSAQHATVSMQLPDGRAVVDYGAAIAIDRDGAQTPVLTATVGNRIVLRLAAEHVAAAHFPLVIDPLIGTNSQLATGDLIDDVDVLHETLTASGVQARLWVAWSMNAAAGDKDIFLYRFAPNFGGAGTENYREISTWDTTHGRLALAPAASRVVLVHSTDFGSNRWITVHSHHTLDNNLVTQSVLVPANLAQSDWRPDVGGRLEPNGSKVLITFQREAVAPFTNTANSTVWATVFDAGVSPQSAAFTVAPFVVLQRANADQERPVVNQFAASNNWIVAFQENNGAVVNDDWDITTVAIDGTGTVDQTQLDTAQAGDPLLHKIAPEIAGSGGRYVLTYTTRVFELPNPKPLGAAGSAIYAQRLDWTPATATGSLPYPAVPLATLGSNGLINGGIAFDPISESHWCAGFQNTAQDRYRISKLGYTGNIVENPLLTLPTGTTPSAIAIAFNQELRRFPIVFAQNSGTTTGNLVQGTLFDYVAVAPPTLIGFACGSGVWGGLDATANRQQIGSQAMPLRLVNAPQDTVALLFVSTAQMNLAADPFGAPGCVLVPDILTPAYLGALVATITGGNALLTLDLPESVPPMTLSLQWAYFVAGANPLGMQASEGLSVAVDR